MKKLFKKVTVSVLTVGMLFSAGTMTDAATIYTVQSGDSLYKIGQKFGLSYQTIKSTNQLNSNIIYPGQKLTISNSFSASELDLLARLVSAEAKGESYAGKVAVATVVLNRVDHRDFPNTINGVIYSKDGGYYAFTPVANGQINKPADADSKRAVKEALAFRGQGNGSLYFYNPKTSTSKWILSKQVTVRIGNHVFAK